MLLKTVQFVYRIIRPQFWSLILCAVTAAICGVVVYWIVWPAYQNPIARMYTSKLGYASVIRKTDGAFPVSTAEVKIRRIVGKFIGEGLMQSEPVQVPMIAMAGIQTVTVVEGQQVRKGDLIVALDDSRIRMKIESAKSALQTARAEMDRVKAGTVSVLQAERPEILAIKARAAEEEVKVAEQILDIKKSLAEKGSVSQSELAAAKLNLIRAILHLRETQIAAESARNGRDNSLQIAQAAIQEAELTLEHRTLELKDYQASAPDDGIVERVLVHEGEYNQDPGRPAVLLACGTWFECYLDQTALGKVHTGDQVEVRLSAYQDRIFNGTIKNIRPLVNFSMGGPETSRPIRPLGTGAPEWPSTFSVRIALEKSNELVVPGLTGYATVIQERETITVPRGTVTSVSGNRGIAFVVGSDGQSFEPRNVVLGIRDDEFVEVKEGLTDGEIVITDGYQVLKPGDRIATGNQVRPPSVANTESTSVLESPMQFVGISRSVVETEPNSQPVSQNSKREEHSILEIIPSSLPNSQAQPSARPLAQPKPQTPSRSPTTTQIKFHTETITKTQSQTNPATRSQRETAPPIQSKSRIEINTYFSAPIPNRQTDERSILFPVAK